MRGKKEKKRNHHHFRNVSPHSTTIEISLNIWLSYPLCSESDFFLMQLSNRIIIVIVLYDVCMMSKKKVFNHYKRLIKTTHTNCHLLYYTLVKNVNEMIKEKKKKREKKTNQKKKSQTQCTLFQWAFVDV